MVEASFLHSFEVLLFVKGQKLLLFPRKVEEQNY